jgi:hypothetical protein
MKVVPSFSTPTAYPRSYDVEDRDSCLSMLSSIVVSPIACTTMVTGTASRVRSCDRERNSLAGVFQPNGDELTRPLFPGDSRRLDLEEFNASRSMGGLRQ